MIASALETVISIIYLSAPAPLFRSMAVRFIRIRV